MDDNELRKLKEGKKIALDGWVYSIQRMDLLIISISGAGVYVVLETLKYSYEHHFNNRCVLKASGILFVLSMIINFSSQWTGKNANLHHIKWANEKIEGGENPTSEQQIKINTHDLNSDVWSKFTNGLNLSSMILMLTGLVSIMIYFMFII